MEEEKREKQEKQAKKFSADYERKLDREISRKLSREFDIRLTAEIQKKFIEDKERKLSGDFRHINMNANSAQKDYGDRKVSDSNNPTHASLHTTSPLSSYHNEHIEHNAVTVSPKIILTSPNETLTINNFDSKPQTRENRSCLINGSLAVEDAT